MAKQTPGVRARIDLASVLVLIAVFGLVLFLVSLGHDPVIATAVASTSGVTATEIIRRLSKNWAPVEKKEAKRDA